MTMPMPSDVNSSLTPREKSLASNLLSRDYDNLYQRHYRDENAPMASELPSCCGIALIHGLLSNISYGHGHLKYDPIKANLQRFDGNGNPYPTEERIVKETQIKIDKAKKNSLRRILESLREIQDRPAASMIAITHAQFMLTGKELYDLGFICIMNNAMSAKTNNRVILMVKIGESQVLLSTGLNPVLTNRNDHEVIRGFTYDEVMAAIDKYDLR